MSIKRIQWVASLCTLLLIVNLSGCGGGSSEEVEIVAKPAETTTSGDNGNTGSNTDNGSGGKPAAEGYGSLTGKVVVDGNFESLKPLYLKGDPTVKDGQVCAAQDLPNESVIVNDGGLANVFIYLDKKPANAKPVEVVADVPVKFDQKYCVFKPHAMAIAVGQPMFLLNSDGVAHNTNIKPQRGKTQNSLVAPQTGPDTADKYIYELPERIPANISCDIHPWMRAYHLPLDHPYVAVSGPDGTFEIKDMPAGDHKLKVWHETGGFLDRGFKVTIEADKSVSEEIKVKPEKLTTYTGAPSRQVVISLPAE